MIELRPVVFILGILLSILAVAMVIPAMVDAMVGHPDWQVFSAASGTTLFVGVSMILTSRSGWSEFSVRQAFVLTTLAWVVIASFGSLPFAYSELGLSVTDAFFESMSGVTTTGSTVIVGLDSAPPGILLWRAILQWLGGIGIIVMAISVLPFLRVGGMQMFRVEAFEADKILPRAAQIAAGICLIYISLTLIAALALWALGMTGFEAVAHAMTAIATGGYSTSDQSLAHFNNPAIDMTISLVMLLGSMPFVLHLRAVRGDPMAPLRDSQVHWMFGLLGLAIASMAAWLWFNGLMPLGEALRHSIFNVISVMTGTGYTSDNFGAWGGFASAVLFSLMFFGGCAGSTTCGMKIFRFQVLHATAMVQFKRLLQPNGVFFAYYNRKPIPDSVTASVLGFFFLYVASFAVLATGLGLFGLDFVTAVSGAATAISNVGPGLGDIIGPTGTFKPLPDAAKWLLTAGMLLGRLELFTVLVLFTPAFWRG